jgi:hypothetical protein
METIKHLLGLCGEPHLNIFSISAIFLLTYIIYKLKLYEKEKNKSKN